MSNHRLSLRNVALFCLLPLCLVLAGCGGSAQQPDPIANVEVDKVPLRLESAELRPIILGGEVSGARYPLQDGHILAVASGFLLDLVFNDALDLDMIRSAMLLNGPAEVNYHLTLPESATGAYSPTIVLYAPEIQPGEYLLTVSADLYGRDTLVME